MNKSDTMKKSWANPSFRKRIMKAQAKAVAERKARDGFAATPSQRKQFSKALTERWQNPEYRKKLSEAMSRGAKARWADRRKRKALLEAQHRPEAKERNVSSTRFTKAQRKAELYGISVKRYLAMSPAERVALTYHNRKVKPQPNPPYAMRQNAKMLGISLVEFDVMSGKEKEAAIYRFKHPKKKK